MTSPPRHGIVLILTAGVCALLALLALTLIMRMRADVAETRTVRQYAQARLMLFAAADYLLEAGRIGWESDTYNPATGLPTAASRHEEAFGWVDVRDGFMGPKRTAYTWDDYRPGGRMDTDSTAFPELRARRTTLGRALTLEEKRAFQPSANFPVGTVGRFPLWVQRRPPFAISLTTTPNPILTSASTPAVPWGDARFGEPYLVKPDPQPAQADFSAAVPLVDIADFRRGDPRPRPESFGQAWFRLYRDGPATFTITCGSGGTQGFRDWEEVVATNSQAVFPGGEEQFRAQLTSETRLWYRCEWSPASAFGVQQQNRTPSSTFPFGESYNARDDNVYSSTTYGDKAGMVTASLNAVGTIPWVQRLRQPPLVW